MLSPKPWGPRRPPGMSQAEFLDQLSDAVFEVAVDLAALLMSAAPHVVKERMNDDAVADENDELNGEARVHATLFAEIVEQAMGAFQRADSHGVRALDEIRMTQELKAAMRAEHPLLSDRALAELIVKQSFETKLDYDIAVDAARQLWPQIVVPAFK